MKWRKAIFAAVALAASKGLARAQPAAVWTYHGDNSRQGAYQAETVLTPGNLSHFGKLFSVPVNGSIYGQPLYVPGVWINGAKHNVVYVATQYSGVYAIDADSGAYLWADGLDSKGLHVYNCDEAEGVYATPVIDTSTDTLYLVVASRYHGAMLQQLLALDIKSGGIKARTIVEPPGFDPTYALNRAALTLANGVIYVAEAVLCDVPYNTRGAHGWVFAYDKTTLKGIYALNTTPHGYGGDIWGGGDGPPVDRLGSAYVSTGNGDFNPALEDYGDSVLKLSPFVVMDRFTPMDEAEREAEDEDLGSGGMTLLPGDELLVTGKIGWVYILDQGNLGGYSPSDEGVVQKFFGGGEMFTTPAVWNNTVYMAPVDEPISAYTLTNGKLNTDPASQSAEAYPFPGGALWVTSNGTRQAILWALQITKTGQVLHAYDATDLTRELGSWPAGSVGSEFRSFICVNGKCYVTSGDFALEVFREK